jgi:hypothetical protein
MTKKTTLKAKSYYEKPKNSRLINFLPFFTTNVFNIYVHEVSLPHYEIYEENAHYGLAGAQ